MIKINEPALSFLGGAFIYVQGGENKTMSFQLIKEPIYLEPDVFSDIKIEELVEERLNKQLYSNRKDKTNEFWSEYYDKIYKTTRNLVRYPNEYDILGNNNEEEYWASLCGPVNTYFLPDKPKQTF